MTLWFFNTHVADITTAGRDVPESFNDWPKHSTVMLIGLLGRYPYIRISAIEWNDFRCNSLFLPEPHVPVFFKITTDLTLCVCGRLYRRIHTLLTSHMTLTRTSGAAYSLL